MSADGVEMHLNAHKKNQPKILSDGCKVSIVSLVSLASLTFFVSFTYLTESGLLGDPN